MNLLEIIRRKEIGYNEKIRKLREFLDSNSEISINKELFRAALSAMRLDIREQMVYLILHHCIEHNSARSEKGEKLSFQNVIDILDEAARRLVTPEYFHRLINFQCQEGSVLWNSALNDYVKQSNSKCDANPHGSEQWYQVAAMEVEARIKRDVIFHGNTLLHQAVISNNIKAIETLLKYGANPLIKNQKGEIPLDLAQGKTRDTLVKGMKKQADSKKWSAAYSSSFGVIPGVFLGVGLGVGSALAGPSMAIILGAAAVFTLVAGIAVGLAIYFLSQDREQAKAIEKAINSEPSSVNNEMSSTPVITSVEKR